MKTSVASSGVSLSRLVMLGLALAATVAFGADAPNSAEVKRITDRYALTRTRISALLDLRQNPVPLPANPPNPFYQSPAVVVDNTPVGRPEPDVVVPAAADESDTDTIRRFAATLKVGGIITRNGVPHLTLNNVACKVGDIVTVGPKDHPTYLKLVALTSGEFTLSLNDATLSVPLRK
jgi:hypothetical protein